MRDAKNPRPSTADEKWKFPPSPPELKEFNVFNIPYIAVLNSRGDEVGAVIENPPKGKTLEETLLDILEILHANAYWTYIELYSYLIRFMRGNRKLDEVIQEISNKQEKMLNIFSILEKIDSSRVDRVTLKRHIKKAWEGII